jgi:hypothetical protein
MCDELHCDDGNASSAQMPATPQAVYSASQFELKARPAEGWLPDEKHNKHDFSSTVDLMTQAALVRNAEVRHAAVESIAGSDVGAQGVQALGFAYRKALAYERHKRHKRNVPRDQLDPDPSYTTRKLKYCTLSPDLRGYMYMKILALIAIRRKAHHINVCHFFARWRRRAEYTCTGGEFRRTHALVALMARRVQAVDASALSTAFNRWRWRLPVARVEELYTNRLHSGAQHLQRALLLSGMRRWVRAAGGSARTRLLTAAASSSSNSSSESASAAARCSAADALMIRVLRAWSERHGQATSYKLSRAVALWRRAAGQCQKDSAAARAESLISVYCAASDRQRVHKLLQAVLTAWRRCAVAAAVRRAVVQSAIRRVTVVLQQWRVARLRCAWSALQEHAAECKHYTITLHCSADRCRDHAVSTEYRHLIQQLSASCQC